MFWSSVCAVQQGVWRVVLCTVVQFRTAAPSVIALWLTFLLKCSSVLNEYTNSGIFCLKLLVQACCLKRKMLTFLFFQQRLHFYDAAPSPFSQSHKSTPQRHPSNQSEGSSTPSAAFPWGRDDSRPAPRRLSPSSSQASGADVTDRRQAQLEPGVCGKESNYRKETESECRSQTVNLVFVLL